MFVSVLASAQQGWKMVMMMVPAASPLLAVGAPRSFLQPNQFLLRPLSNSRFLSRQPVFFAIAPDMLQCEIPLHPGVAPILITILIVRRTRRCPDGLGPGESQSLTSNSLPRHSKEILELSPSDSLIKNFSLGVTHWSLANSDSMAPSLI